MAISETLKALLVATKTPGEELFNSDFVRTTLAELYHPDINLRHCFEKVFNAVMEMRAEPKFEMPYGEDKENNLIFKIIFAPVDESLYSKVRFPNTTTTHEQVYELMIGQCLSLIKLSRIDWCREELGLN